jgi:hypothetical protein
VSSCMALTLEGDVRETDRSMVMYIEENISFKL